MDSEYSGKSLLGVPEEKLRVGMKVISPTGVLGEITRLRFPPEDRELSIDFKWENGRDSLMFFHAWTKKFIVR